MRRSLLPILACVAALAMAIAVPAASASPSAPAPAKAKVSALDKMWLMSSIQTDLAEISAGKLALSKSSNAPVRRAATRYIKDHTNMLRTGRALAAALHVPAPTSPNPMQVWAAQILKTLRGSTFNHWYASLEVAGHKVSIQLTVTEIRNGTNAAIRHAAAMALPMLQAHLRLAEAALRANP